MTVTTDSTTTTTTTTAARPRGALFGVASFVVALAGTLAYPAEPDFVADPATLATFYADNSSELLAADTLYLLSMVLFLAFAATLWSRSRRAEGGAGTTAMAGLAGAIAGATLSFAGAAFDLLGALRVEERGSIDPQVAAVYWDASSALYGLAAPMAISVLVLATAVLALRHRLLPAWHGIVSVPLGLALLVPPISYIAMIVFTFWLLLTGLVLYLVPAAGVPERS